MIAVSRLGGHEVMKKAARIFVVSLLASLVWASTVAAQPRQMRFSGCVRAGVAPGCRIVHSGAVMFNVSTARPRPRLDRWIMGTGFTSAEVTSCNQGVPLRAVSWHYVRRQCPPAAPPPQRP